MQIASAPVSWGITESVAFPAEYPYSRVLDEIAEAGYAGTELGPYGLMPTDPAVLRRELDRRGLTLCSAFVAMALGDSGQHAPALARVTRTARLISQLGCRLLILSDEISPERCAVAGSREKAGQLSWTLEEWNSAERAIREASFRCAEFGLKTAFHHHAGTHVETPEEIDRLFSLFSSEDLGLCLDTGHCLYGGGDPEDLLARYANRLLSVHLKDVDAGNLSNARARNLDFYAAVRSGVFVPLGQGTIDFGAILGRLKQQELCGWVVIEQDVLEGGKGAASPLANASAARTYLRGLGY